MVLPMFLTSILAADHMVLVFLLNPMLLSITGLMVDVVEAAYNPGTVIPIKESTVRIVDISEAVFETLFLFLTRGGGTEQTEAVSGATSRSSTTLRSSLRLVTSIRLLTLVITKTGQRTFVPVFYLIMNEDNPTSRKPEFKNMLRLIIQLLIILDCTKSYTHVYINTPLSK